MNALSKEWLGPIQSILSYGVVKNSLASPPHASTGKKCKRTTLHSVKPARNPKCIMNGVSNCSSGPCTPVHIPFQHFIPVLQS